jgi:peptidoglycan/LPS O-acetylase OafA/YrhL
MAAARDTFSLSYRPEIDGLRACAIVSVMLFHGSVPAFRGGFVGVDVFFVVSGYLIASFIRSGQAAGDFDISRFYLRRARRILPAMIVATAATLAAGWVLLLPDDLKRLGGSAAAQVVFSANWRFWRSSDYFAPRVDAIPLLHTWSLSLEEQFYLVFPLILVGLARFARRGLPLLLSAAAVVSFAWCVQTMGRDPAAAFYLLPSRAWELLLGAAAAYAPGHASQPSRLGRAVDQTLSGLGLALIGFAVVTYSANTTFPGWSAVLPCGGAVAVLWSNRGRVTLVGRLLSATPLLWIGLRSYSLYLWHWPILSLAQYSHLGPLSGITIGALLVLAVAVASLSYWLVEHPIRRGIRLRRPSTFAAIVIVSLAFLALAGSAIDGTGGVPSRLPATLMAAYAEARRPPTLDEDLCRWKNVDGITLCVSDNALDQPDVLLWGDSHAAAVLPAVNPLAARLHLRTWMSGCPAILGVHIDRQRGRGDQRRCPAENDRMIRYLESHHVGTVLVTAYWSIYTEPAESIGIRPSEPDKFLADDASAPHTSGEARIVFRRRFTQTVQRIARTGASVIVMKDVPSHSFDTPRALAQTLVRGEHADGLGKTLAEHRARQSFADGVFRELAADGVRVLDPADVFCSDGWCRAVADGHAMYSDSDHLNLAGALRLAPMLEPVLRAASRERE